MQDGEPPVWFIWVAFGWVTFVILASIVYGISANKPIFPKVATDAAYSERWASGPFAANCLLVYVTHDALSVVPRFPFNLMFLPEIYRLERTILLNSISAIKRNRTSTSNVQIEYGDMGKVLRLRVRNPEALIASLGSMQPR